MRDRSPCDSGWVANELLVAHCEWLDLVVLEPLAPAPIVLPNQAEALVDGLVVEHGVCQLLIVVEPHARCLRAMPRDRLGDLVFAREPDVPGTRENGFDEPAIRKPFGTAQSSEQVDEELVMGPVELDSEDAGPARRLSRAG